MIAHFSLGEFVDKYKQTDKRFEKQKHKQNMSPNLFWETGDFDTTSYYLRFKDIKEFKHKEGGGKWLLWEEIGRQLLPEYNAHVPVKKICWS